ncbi:MAG: hypothetical protein ACK41T_00115 [Pseudobdellovibrio sp.]
MIRLVQLLTEKNHFLEKFYSLNERQISKLEDGHYDDIENFYNKREDLINILKYMDTEISKAHSMHREINGVFTDTDRAALRECMRVKEMFVEKILDQDIQVLALIDVAKSKIIKELQDVRLAKKALTGYKTNVA